MTIWREQGGGERKARGGENRSVPVPVRGGTMYKVQRQDQPLPEKAIASGGR
jgi:hypothetical protein